jgi:2-polyprenyl-3-methyl-5-hydroxy-6-metoxy-1,4-benzoquinol methylase
MSAHFDGSLVDSFGAAQFDPLATLYDEFTKLWDEVDTTVSNWVTVAVDTGAKRYNDGAEDHYARALDVGCGAGRYSVLLAEHAMSVLAVDPSLAMLDIARRDRPSPNIRYQRGKLEHLVPTLYGQFHYVLSVRTMHHAGNQDGAVQRIKQMVIPGGRLIVVDMVNPGEWTDREFHQHRAVLMADYAERVTSYPRARQITLDLLTHPEWLSSVVRDVPLSPHQFREVYGRHLPGAVFYNISHMTQAVVWDAPADAAPAVHVTQTASL